MRRRLLRSHLAQLGLLVLLGVAACSGGSGEPAGAGTPLSFGGDEPTPPTRDNPGAGRDNPNGPGAEQGAGGCPCAGDYACGGIGADGGTAALTITASGDTCTWSASGTPIELACNGSTMLQGELYTSSWSGTGIQLCLVVQGQGSTCITCNPGE
jgi:hypothetical protein